MVHVCVLFGSTMQFVVHLLSLSSSTVSSDKTVIVHPGKNDVWSARKKNQYNQPKVPGGNSPNLNGSQLKPFSFSQVLAKFQALSDWFCNWITKFYDTCSFSPTLFTVRVLSQGKIGLPSLGHFAQVPTKIIITCSSSNHQIFDLANREDSLAYLSELQGRTNWNKNDIFPQYQSYQNDSQ